MKSNTRILAGAVILLAIAFLVYWYENRNTIPPANNNQGSNPTDVNKTISYKDGNYNTTVDYMTPAGKESVSVSISLLNGNISTLQVQNLGNDKTSKNYQDKFISGINSISIGQAIETLKIGVVSGSSLTSGAFNNALANIKSQAIN